MWSDSGLNDRAAEFQAVGVEGRGFGSRLAFHSWPVPLSLHHVRDASPEKPEAAGDPLRKLIIHLILPRTRPGTWPLRGVQSGGAIHPPRSVSRQPVLELASHEEHQTFAPGTNAEPESEARVLAKCAVSVAKLSQGLEVSQRT